MEDVLDTFLTRVRGPNSTEPKSLLKHLGERMTNLFTKSKARQEISVNTKDIMSHLQEVTERCGSYKVDDIVARPATASTLDPRLAAMYNKVEDLVGINESSGKLISMLRPSSEMAQQTRR
jgi:disease resistance protein RPM1